MKSTRAHFGSIGITLTLSPPGQHAQRSERYTRVLDERSTSTLDRLPYVLPPKLLLFLDMNVAMCMNYTPNSRSFPMTPYEKVNGVRKRFHETTPFLPFGTVCMIQMGEAKRAKSARVLGYQVNKTLKREMAVCLGEDPALPQSYLFYIQSTDLIVPRREFKILSDSVIPFDWKPKPSMFRVLKQFPVDITAAVGANLNIQSVNNAIIPEAPYKDVVISTPPVHIMPLPLIPSGNIFPVILQPPAPTTAPLLPAAVLQPVPPSLEQPQVVFTPKVPDAIPQQQSTGSLGPDRPIVDPVSLVIPQRRTSPRSTLPASPLPRPPMRQSSRITKSKQAPIFEYSRLGGTNTQSLVSALNNNFTMPRLLGSVYPACQVYQSPAPKIRNTFFRPIRKINKMHAGNDAYDDQSWYSPPPSDVVDPTAFITTDDWSPIDSTAAFLSNVLCAKHKDCEPPVIFQILLVVPRHRNISHLRPMVLIVPLLIFLPLSGWQTTLYRHLAMKRELTPIIWTLKYCNMSHF